MRSRNSCLATCWAAQGTVRSALEPLAQAFFFDAVESDDRLALPPAWARARGDHRRPGPAAAGRAHRRGLARATDPGARAARAGQRRSTSTDTDYGQGTQSAKRVSGSLASGTTGSRQQLSLQLAIVIDATTAKRIAERTLLRLARAQRLRGSTAARLAGPRPDRCGRRGLSRRAPPSARGSPGSMSAPTSRWRCRASRRRLPLTCRRRLPMPGRAGLPQAIAGDTATRLILVDLPLLRDADDTGGPARGSTT